MTKLLKITTPEGEFNRRTSTAYTHAVVRRSLRAFTAYENRGTATRRAHTGVNGRRIKDRGFAVTRHGSGNAAWAAAARPYARDSSTEPVGIYPVEA